PDRGPRVALQVMREAGISGTYVIDKQRKLLGYISAGQATMATKENKSIEDVMTREVPSVHPDTLLTDLFESVASANVPLAVVDESNRLQGIVVKGAIMGAMAGNDKFIHGNGVTSS